MKLGGSFLALFLAGVLEAQMPDYDTLVAIHGELEDASTAKSVSELETRLAAIDISSWERSEKVDYLLVGARLAGKDFELRVMRPRSRDPLRYIDRMRRVAYEDVPVSDVAAFRDRLRGVRKIVTEARVELTEPSAELARLAIRHLEQHDGVGQGEPVRHPQPAGIIGWYRDLDARVSRAQPELAANVNETLEAVVGFRDWLEEKLPSMTAPAWIDLDDYAWYLRNVRLLPHSVEDVRRIGARELDRALTFLKIEEHRNRGLPELEIATSKDELDRRVVEAERQIRALINEQSLLTLPPDTQMSFETDVFFTRRPEGKRHFWEELSYRNALNNHVHASIPGHRFDGFLQRRVDNPIRRAHRDGVRGEGWGFYIEEMLLQAGLLDELPRARELFYVAQIARAVRIPAELAMQTGEMSLDEAIRYMVDLVPYMEEDLARYDLQIYLRRPAYGMNYTIGMAQIEELLAREALRLGGDFDLGVFHDTFLSKGMIPIALIGWEMSGDDEAYAWLLQAID